MKTMKTKQSFIIIEKAFDGFMYQLDIYENKGIGKLVYLNNVVASTRCYNGELNEAYYKLVELNAFKPSINRAIKSGLHGLSSNYYTELGAKLIGLEIVLL